MTIAFGGTGVVKIYVGDDEIDRGLIGRRQFFARPALPTLTASLSRSYDQQGATAGTITVTFAASAGARVSIRRLSDNAPIPLTSNTTATFAAPVADETIEVTATNAEGTVHVDLPYYRWTTPVFSGVHLGTFQNHADGSRSPVVTGTLALSPWLSPALELAPEQDGFTSRGFQRSLSSGPLDRRTFRVQGTPRLQTDPVRSVTITLSAQVRIGTELVGSAVTQRVTASY